MDKKKDYGNDINFPVANCVPIGQLIDFLIEAKKKSHDFIWIEISNDDYSTTIIPFREIDYTDEELAKQKADYENYALKEIKRFESAIAICKKNLEQSNKK